MSSFWKNKEEEEKKLNEKQQQESIQMKFINQPMKMLKKKTKENADDYMRICTRNNKEILKNFNFPCLIRKKDENF
ncbi:hypothetical protein DERP_013200 [Dermatophagoides pteronyssinus]|uniref:Uncharacterized protein n=1 Tax=Dermatophagoides pteronyssinus TaxID=6956 RepID=A0ABQ8J3H5_DERPT|nr:hypothetical protein DERP_013200 [Dermatophagoides pteronyssinus]